MDRSADASLSTELSPMNTRRLLQRSLENAVGDQVESESESEELELQQEEIRLAFELTALEVPLPHSQEQLLVTPFQPIASDAEETTATASAVASRKQSAADRASPRRHLKQQHHSDGARRKQRSALTSSRSRKEQRRASDSAQMHAQHQAEKQEEGGARDNSNGAGADGRAVSKPSVFLQSVEYFLGDDMKNLASKFRKEAAWLGDSEKDRILITTSDAPGTLQRMSREEFVPYALRLVRKERKLSKKFLHSLKKRARLDQSLDATQSMSIPPLSPDRERNTSGKMESPRHYSNMLTWSRVAAVEKEQTVWIDIQEASPDFLKMLGPLFSIHPLTVEDCMTDTLSREKAEQFDEYLFVKLSESDLIPGTNRMQVTSVYLLIFSYFIISIHSSASKALPEVLFRLRYLRDVNSFKTPDWILYAFLDLIVDAYFGRVKGIENEVNTLDKLVFVLTGGEQADLLKRIGRAKKVLAGLRTELLVKREIVLSLHHSSKEALSFVSPNTRTYLRDVRDHISYMLHTLQDAQDTLNHLNANYVAMISLEMTAASNRMNSVMKKFSAVATIFLPLTVLTGLFGMNVVVPGQNSTDLGWFFGILGVMLVGSALLFFVFRRQRWC